MLTTQALAPGPVAEASEDCGLVLANVNSFLSNFRIPGLASLASKQSNYSTPQGVFFFKQQQQQQQNQNKTKKRKKKSKDLSESKGFSTQNPELRGNAP